MLIIWQWTALIVIIVSISIYLHANLTAHRPIAKRARGEKMYTNKKREKKEKQ
jgi:hypothetical protein